MLVLGFDQKGIGEGAEKNFKFQVKLSLKKFQKKKKIFKKKILS